MSLITWQSLSLKLEAKAKSGVILSAAVLQAERRISHSSTRAIYKLNRYP